MPNSNHGANMTNDSAQLATLSIRVTSMEGRVNELNAAVTSVQSTLSTKIDTLAQSLGSKIEDRSRPQWAIYIAAAMAVFSVYAYMDTAKIGPLKEVDGRIEGRLDRVANKIENDMVPAKTHAREWALNDERFSRVDDRFKLIDERIKASETSMLERIRFGETSQIDRIKRVEDIYSNTYNMRDALQQLDSRIQHFERMTVDKSRQ